MKKGVLVWLHHVVGYLSAAQKPGSWNENNTAGKLRQIFRVNVVFEGKLLKFFKNTSVLNLAFRRSSRMKKLSFSAN